MQNHELCYYFDSNNKTISIIKLQSDIMNGGFMPKPSDASYIDPSTIEIEDNETLILIDDGQEIERWEKIPYFIDKKLYHKIDKSEITISEVGKSPDDYPDYTEKELPGDTSSCYNFSESINDWLFDLEKYKSDALSRVTSMCIEANYSRLPQYKRDNIYAGSPVSADYPDYLQGEAGRLTIAKLNEIYQKISKAAKIEIESAISQTEIDDIIAGIIFPSDEEIWSMIQD